MRVLRKWQTVHLDDLMGVLKMKDRNMQDQLVEWKMQDQIITWSRTCTTTRNC